MAEITFKGIQIRTSGSLPPVGSIAPEFCLVNTNLEEVKLSNFDGVRVLNVFPSVDTAVCATSVRIFNKEAGSMDGVEVLNVSADLPFAHKRFCGAENLAGVVSLSCFRSTFPEDYGLKIDNGILAGLCSRVVIVVDSAGRVLYSEQVPDIGSEPNYDAALAATGKG